MTMSIFLCQIFSCDEQLKKCHFVRWFIPFFTLLVSLESEVCLECYKISKSVNGVQWLSMGVNGCFKGVSRVF